MAKLIIHFVNETGPFKKIYFGNETGAIRQVNAGNEIPITRNSAGEAELV